MAFDQLMISPSKSDRGDSAIDGRLPIGFYGYLRAFCLRSVVWRVGLPIATVPLRRLCSVPVYQCGDAWMKLHDRDIDCVFFDSQFNLEVDTLFGEHL